MASPNRAALIAKAHKVLKQHYKPVEPDESRSLLEQMLFACCLENAHYETAEKIYSRLRNNFFDWNEVRVSTVNELAEVMKDHPEPTVAASNLKRILQSTFESTYSFDIDSLRKQNLGAGIKKLEQTEGVTPFVLNYTVQTALGGHAIPLDRGALETLAIVGAASPTEVQSANVTGLERAIPKNKGVEFGSLLHQLAADYIATPNSPNVKKVLTAINPEATIPRRDKAAEAKAAEAKLAEQKAAKAAEEKAAAEKAAKDGKAAKAGEKEKAAPADKKGRAPETKHDDKKPARPVKTQKEKPAKKEAPPKKAAPRPAALAGKKSPTKQLTKKKPR